MCGWCTHCAGCHQNTARVSTHSRPLPHRSPGGEWWGYAAKVRAWVPCLVGYLLPPDRVAGMVRSCSVVAVSWDAGDAHSIRHEPAAAASTAAAPEPRCSFVLRVEICSTARRSGDRRHVLLCAWGGDLREAVVQREHQCSHRPRRLESKGSSWQRISRAVMVSESSNTIG